MSHKKLFFFRPIQLCTCAIIVTMVETHGLMKYVTSIDFIELKIIVENKKCKLLIRNRFELDCIQLNSLLGSSPTSSLSNLILELISISSIYRFGFRMIRKEFFNIFHIQMNSVKWCMNHPLRRLKCVVIRIFRDCCISSQVLCS